MIDTVVGISGLQYTLKELKGLLTNLKYTIYVTLIQ